MGRDTPRDTPSTEVPGYASGHTTTPNDVTAGHKLGTHHGIHRDTPPQYHRDALYPPEGDTRSQDHICPTCKSNRTIRPSSFDPTSHHVCWNCGHRWNPHDKHPMDVSP